MTNLQTHNIHCQMLQWPLFHVRAVVFTLSMLFLLAASNPAISEIRANDESGLPIDGRAWKDLIVGMTPFGIDVTVFNGTGNQTMECQARIYVEFSDHEHVYQYATLFFPFPLEYRSFSTGAATIIHDLDTDAISSILTRLSPVSVFSLEDSADSFFSRVRFEDVEPETFDNKSTFVFKITADSMPISPGQDLIGINGHLWLDAKRGRPIKLIVMGKTQVTGGDDVPTSLIIDFRYKGLLIKPADLRKVDASIKAYKNDDDVKADALIRSVEKHLISIFSPER